MVSFTPRFMQVLVFDLEAYVPESDRKRKYGHSLTVNPYSEAHSLIGGVFSLKNPVTGEVFEDFSHHWVWDAGSEKELVKEIYEIFASMQKRIQDKPMHCADPVVCGVGIATFDMPFLYAKFLEHKVAAPAEIFEAFCKNRVVDLSVAGIGFLPKQAPLMHPRSHNDLADRFILNRVKKPSGKVVWELFDDGEYNQIAQRCEGEVREMAEIYEGMYKESLSGDREK